MQLLAPADVFHQQLSFQNTRVSGWKLPASIYQRSIGSVLDSSTPRPAVVASCRLPSGQQLMHFFSFLAAGGLFLFLAFFIGLPALLLSPSKFALFFTIGCCLVLSAFASLKGWRTQMRHMLARDRLPFSAGVTSKVQ